jgi:homoserine kinase type II
MNPDLSALFRHYPEPFRPLAVPEPLGGAGGHSGARLWRYRAAAGQFVLRAWPAHGSDRDHLERVHHWLSMTADLGFTAVPIRDISGQSLREHDGRLWEIAPWLDGTPDCGHAPSPGHRRTAFAALATFHLRLATLGQEGHSPGLFERHRSLRQLIDGGFDVLDGACRSARNPPDGPRDHALRWIALARPLAPDVEKRLSSVMSRGVFLQPCLRDARSEHFLFDGERLSGLVDFGAMGIETVAADLARLIGEWLEGDIRARDDALAAYTAIKPLSASDSSLIEVFESSAAILIGERWVRWHYLDHRTFDDPEAVERGIAKSINQMQRLAANHVGDNFPPLIRGGQGG